MSARSTLSALAFVVATTCAMHARAQASEASALSALPLLMLMDGPSAVLGSGAELTVTAVQLSAAGATWVMERASDGTRASFKLAGKASMSPGTRVAVSVAVAGYVLSVAGQAVAFVPNEMGASLLHNERVTQ